jgi:hypothetical protein
VELLRPFGRRLLPHRDIRKATRCSRAWPYGKCRLDLPATPFACFRWHYGGDQGTTYASGMKRRGNV